ncbi:hypothetical protein D3C87_626210 [compost metagenome]
MAISSLLVPGVNIPQPDNSWLSSIADSIGGAITNVRADRSFTGLADRLQGGASAPQQPAGGFLSSLAGPQAQQQPAQTAPVAPVSRGALQGDTYKPFIETVRSGGLTNPYGLAAVAATGKAESGWSAKNAMRTWSDPSESGQAGTAGGILSWRGPRYQALAATGDLSPQGQAKFFLQENPQLIQKLNNAKSVEEAQQLMNNAWAFAGYNRPGGESARRMALAQNYYANEFGNAPTNGGAAAIEAIAPLEQGDTSGTETAYVDPMVKVEPRADTAPYTMASPTAPQPQGQAPMQVADSSGASGLIAQGVTPVQRGSVDPSIIQYMLRDRNLRDVGLKLWAANAEGQKAGEPWQFVNLPDGTLARANQQTGAVERLGTFSKPKEEKALINLGDGQLFDPNTRETIDAGGGRKKAPSIVELFDEQTGQPYKARWNDEAGTFERVGGVKARSGMSLTTNPDGTVTLTEGTVGNMPKLTESEGRNSGFYGRGIESQNILNSLESEGTSVWNKTVGNLPVVGNFARSEDAQKYDQAKRNFINAVLRRESGAVISPEEFANAEQQYFPQPGDGEEVIIQKRRNRDTTIQGLKVSSGQGAQFALPSGQAPQPPSPPSPPAPPQAGVSRVTSPADYERLPSGARYTDPNGNIRTKR